MQKEELIAIRNAIEMTQHQFAVTLGTTVTTVSRWENGHTKPSPAYTKEIHRLQERNGIKTS